MTAQVMILRDQPAPEGAEEDKEMKAGPGYLELRPSHLFSCLDRGRGDDSSVKP